MYDEQLYNLLSSVQPTAHMQGLAIQFPMSNGDCVAKPLLVLELQL